MVAVLLFLAAIYFIVIPNYRESLMNGKRETIRELTNTAWSVMHKLDMMVSNDFDIKDAQNEAVIIIRDMRYGPEFKDYFWITDTFPRMVMHPYRPSLNGMDLTNYQDPRGKNFFVDIANIVKAHGDGYVDYKWQWKDDSLTVVPKLSYVKAYKPWGWIIGTGIYIEDVNREISKLTSTVVWISGLITILIAAIISYLARRNYLTEIERQRVQERLIDSMQRYKKLVEASTDGVLMIVENEIVYCNPYLLNLLNYTQTEFDQHDQSFFETLNSFIVSCNNQLKDLSSERAVDVSVEQIIFKKNGMPVSVVVNLSKFDIDGKQGRIYAIKDVSKHKDVERELDLSMEKIQSIAGLLNIGIFRCTVGRQSRFVDINKKALDLLGYTSQLELKDIHVQKLFDVSDEKKDVIKAINEGSHVKEKMLRVKRADGTVLTLLVSLFPVSDIHGNVVFCDGFLVDAYDRLCHDSDFEKETAMLQVSANVLLHPISDYTLNAPKCSMSTAVSAAASLMNTAKSDIVLVVNDDNSIIGLLTHSDISRRIVAKSENHSIPVSMVMSSPVISVSDQDMVMDAFALMLQHKISYVVVKSAQGKDAAYISLLKLSELRKDTPEFLLNAIQKSESTFEIAEVMKQLPRLVSNLVGTGTGVPTTGRLISRISDAVTEKIIHQAIAELGPPPSPFIFLALGSEGRKEQTLATDQDNAIIYKPTSLADNSTCNEYFLKLGNKTCYSLNQAGYPFCKGGVMSMNSEWCKSFDNWQITISDWINTPNPQEILNTSIFFDFRPIYGDFDLANSLQKFCIKSLKDKNIFFFNLAKSISSLKISPVDNHTFSQDSYDLKMPILAITSIARLWSLRYGISERNTYERFYALQTLGSFSSNLHEEFNQSLRFLSMLRIKNQLRQISDNIDVNNTLNPKELSEIERIMLKKSVSTIVNHFARVNLEFRIS